MAKYKYLESIGTHAILKRVTGLRSVQFKSRPAKYTASSEAYARKDRDYDGEFLEDFDENVISSAKTYLAPFYNQIKDSYWLEKRWILEELQDRLKVRYPTDHYEFPGRIIKPEDIDPTNFYDPFFMSNQLKTKRMEGGKYSFQLQEDPLDALLFYSYKHNPKVLVRDGREISKYVVGTANFELIIPSEEQRDDKNKLKKLTDSLTLLGKLDFDRQKHIAFIMKLRLNDYVNPNPDAVYLELGKVAQSTNLVPRWAMTWQDKFISLANMSNEDLMMWVDITKGKDLRIITVERGEYFINSELIKGVKDEENLFKFLQSEENVNKYRDLLFLIDEKSK